MNETKKVKEIVLLFEPLKKKNKKEIEYEQKHGSIIFPLSDEDIFNINEDPENKENLNKLFYKDVHKTIINLDGLERNMSKVDRLRESIHVIRTNKDTKHSDIVFVGAKSLILYLFDFPTHTQVFNSIEAATAYLN